MELNKLESLICPCKTDASVKLSLKDVEDILRQSKVERGEEDDRNPVEIASSLRLIGLIEVERVESGYFDKVDQSRMITDGRIIESIAFGQRVLQAVELDDTIR